MAAEQVGSARCSRAQSVCVKCSTQERRCGSSSGSTTGSGWRGWGDGGGRGRGCVEVGLERSSSGSTMGSGKWSTGGGEGDEEDDLEPIGAGSVACAGWGGRPEVWSVVKASAVPCPWVWWCGGP